MASFAATLAEAPPAQAFSKAQGLVRSTLFFISNDLAQSLADRLNAERIYCDALVTRTPPKSKLPKEFTNLPPLPPFLQSLKASLCVQEVQSIQSVHDKFRGRIEAEVFGPLRAFGNGPEWDRLRLLEGNVEKIIRDFEDCTNRLQKAQKKLEGTSSSSKGYAAAQSKVDGIRAELSNVLSNYSSLSPSYYSAVEQIWRRSIDQVKESITLYQTIQNDMGRERMEVSERGMVDALAIESTTEVDDWALKAAQEFGTRLRAPSTRANTTNNNAAPPSPSPMLPERPRTSTPSVHSTNAQAQSHANPKFSALSSLMKRDRSSSNTSATRRNTIHQHRVPSNDNLENTLTPPPSSLHGHAEPANAVRRSDDDGASALSMPSSSRERGPRSSFLPNLMRRKSKSYTIASFENNPPSASLHQARDDRSILSEEVLVEEQPRSTIAPQANVDADGFTIPPKGHDDPLGQPVEVDSDSGRTPTKMTLSIAPAPVSTPAPAEQDPERQAALQRIQSTLLSSKTSATGPTRRGTTRGRRGEKPAPSPDVPPLPLNPNGFASHLPPPVPENEVATNPFSSSPASIPDNLVNGHSQPATIVVKVQEEISVTSHNGVVGPATVSGTIVVSPSNSKKTENAPIPDVEFDVVPSANIESIGMLNDLVSAHPSVPNRYIIDKRCFQNSGFIFGGLPLLRYTFKGDVSIPLHARTAWKTEEHLTSLIVSYEPNSGYPLNLQSLDNLSISALIPNSVTSHQARPEGEMDTSTNRLVWNLEPHARTERSKILARFATTTRGEPFPMALNWTAPSSPFLRVETSSSVMLEQVAHVLGSCSLV